jgi:TolB protein
MAGSMDIPSTPCRVAMLLVVCLAGVSGCSMSMSVTPQLTPSATTSAAKPAMAPSAPEYLPDSLIDNGSLRSDPNKAPVVNVFGEFDRSRANPRTLAAVIALKQHTFTESGFDADVQVDPSVQALLFTSARDGEATKIYQRRFDSLVTTQLTNTAADDAQPCYSPDGKRIAFGSNRSGRWHVYLMNADGRNLIQLTQGDSNDMHPSFSPDGTHVVYSSLPVATAPGDPWQLWTIDLVSRQQTMIGEGLFPAWSPDKTRDRIAFQKARSHGSKLFGLWTCEIRNNDSDQPEAVNVCEILASPNAALVSPSWSPDGRQLAYIRISESAAAHSTGVAGRQELWTVDADGTHGRRLSDSGSVNLTPFWAVDNRVYFISDRSGHESIWSLPATAPAPSDNKPMMAVPVQPATAGNETASLPKPANAARTEPETSTVANEPAELRP